ncbi:FAD dependent oxidoreductase-domain-containing protein [Xylariaceae sp. FL0662B]|nr:FAD dependent oxidoreductase-domain-containing protein [Xylariaceae sp. FL0662B]
MSTKQELLQLYEGQVVPRAFNAGFVVLSYVVSLTGAASTLELLNRRTSRNGLFNHVILFSAAVTMGGIAIWCMHFIGNRAIVLGHDELELQIAYSSGFTALSFFLPIFVLLVAFIAIGAHNRVSCWRICGGGTLAGFAICGMHYLGNASIDNYTCIYNVANVVGAALIAVVASTVALSLFFVFRASWTNTWWKRGLSAVVLAGAVSGMHWCASTGTHYRLISLNESSQLARTTTVVVVICLSIGAAFIIAGTVIYTTWAKRRYANKAQQIILAAAVFDRSGRILVSTDGLLPSEKITDTYVERTQSDTFDIAHPLFHWMFQASRNWKGVSSMIAGITNHLTHLSRGGRDRRIPLTNDNGQLIENYDILFRELFCLAAANLADKMKEPLSNVGILWDEILVTGAGGSHRKRLTNIDRLLERGIPEDLAEKGERWVSRQQEYGQGSLMFLARRLDNSHDVDRLEAAGFRFADVHQIKTRNLGDKLMNMATFAEENTVTEPGVHLGFFGVRARVGTSGFDILVKKGARNLLPSMQIPLERLESWQTDVIRQFDRMSVPLLLQSLDALKKLSPREMLFASQITDALEALRAWIDDPIFDEAVLTSKVVQAPCRIRASSGSVNTCTMIALRLMIPIHDCIKSPKCEFIPLNFFKVHQMVYRDSPQHAAFTRYMHRELSPILKAAPVGLPQASYQQGGGANPRGNRLSSLSNSFRRLRQPSIAIYPIDEDGNPIPTEARARPSSNSSSHTGSTSKLWKQNSSDRQRQYDDATPDSTAAQWTKAQGQPSSFGGILVSQEIKVDVRQAEDVSDAPLSAGRQSYCHGGAGLGGGLPQRTTNTDPVKAGRSFELEMKYLPEASGNVSPLGSAVIESEKVNEVMTFVDELFAIQRIALPTTIAAVGGGVLLYSYRPRNIPGFEGPAVPPPIYGADGTFKLPRFPAVKSREEQIADLKKSSLKEGEEYDMLVIGGGATGAGVALDAATRGLKVALVERDDFSSGTSSKSTKLVHGGVRYLEKAVWNLDYAQYQLVKEALKERKYFLQTAPHLSSWLPIMLPLDKWWKAPYYWAGTKFYDLLAGSEGIESSYFLTKSKALDAFPMLKQTDLVGALVYYDGAHNDSRMNVSIAMTAAVYGATIVNHAEVTSLMKNENGKLCGATVKDVIPERNGRSAEDIRVNAKCIINCTGPFTDSIRKLDDQGCKEIVAPASGVHVILPGYYSPSNMGLIDPSTSDGRVIFFLPWQGNTIAGTTDEPTKISPNPLPDEKSIQWILDEISHYLSPDIKVRRGDVLAAWAGIRPLVKNPKAANTESLVRNHLIDISDSGLVTCAGGKWTTYRQMAEECVDAAVKEFNLPTKPFENAPRVSGTEAIDDGAILNGGCQTHNVRLVGAHGFSKTLFINLIQHFGVETEVAKHLTESYGDRAWTVAALCKPTDLRFPARGERVSRQYPFVDGEIRYAVKHEYAQTAVDVIARRTRLAFLNAQAALECLPKVIDIMSQELKWDKARQDREWKDTVKFLESMGLPEPMLTATRAQVEKGKLDFSSSLEYKMYSRHDKPPVAE